MIFRSLFYQAAVIAAVLAFSTSVATKELPLNNDGSTALRDLQPEQIYQYKSIPRNRRSVLRNVGNTCICTCGSHAKTAPGVGKESRKTNPCPTGTTIVWITYDDEYVGDMPPYQCRPNEGGKPPGTNPDVLCTWFGNC